MRAHFLQHVRFEGLGFIESWLISAGHSIIHSRLFKSEELPSINDLDLLIVMGGPMSVNDEERFPWLTREEEFTREVINAGKPVLDICLGAQLIAKAMGAVAEKIRRRVVDSNITHRPNPAGVVTMSIGLALLKPGDTSDMDTLYKKADSALYQAKQKGGKSNRLF